MITRIVRMQFIPGQEGEFLRIFSESKEKIAAFPGCYGLELLHDISEKNRYFTRSLWEKPEDLDAYRRSELFRITWKKTKALFSGPADAWSMEQII